MTENLTQKQDRDVYRDADAIYHFAVGETDDGRYVAFERDGSVETYGDTQFEALVNYVRGIESASSDG